MKTAIFIDGGFYRKRIQTIDGPRTPEQCCKDLITHCFKHLESGSKEDTVRDDLYRIFYYDCPPIRKKIKHPLTGVEIDLSKTELYAWTNEFIECMKKQRKVALRLGRLAEEHATYILKPIVVKALCNNQKSISDLTESDFSLDVKQKGVDMKIGVDIASVAFKRQVDRIVLIAGDSDFVPAAKLARREGIDFILDPMWNHINPDLFEHIDGLQTQCKKPSAVKSSK